MTSKQISVGQNPARSVGLRFHFHSFHIRLAAALTALLFGLWFSGSPRVTGAETDSSSIVSRLKTHGLTKGIAVVLGDQVGIRAETLAKQTELTVYAQIPNPDLARQVREEIAVAGGYGTRIFLDPGDLSQLFLADNVADVVIAEGDTPKLTDAEVLRVLRPEGKAWLAGRELSKPWPAGVDDWSHPYHGPDNNPLSSDRLAKGPYLTQFLADPRYAPLPQLAVASAGRIFKLFGHIAFKIREEPWLNTMAAFNGFNGSLLWRREIPASLVVHRNVLIATPQKLYFGDDQSCQVIDPATGESKDAITIPAEITRDAFWKWMALEDGILYALLGPSEPRDPVVKLRSVNHGWPWDPLSPGYNTQDNSWGFGNTVVALDPQTKRIRWHHREAQPIDSRALCLKNNRLFLFRQDAFLQCLEAQTGRPLWRKTREENPEFFAEFGKTQNRQDWRTNWRTVSYAKCSDQALYFAGPTISKLLAVSASDGRLLWEHPYDNFQLIIHPEGLFGISGQIDNNCLSMKFDPLTGKILSQIAVGRRACTRPTAAPDALFFRASGGSTRLDVVSQEPQLVSPMRAQCHDGVTIANGLLYWWPSVCDCNLTLYGITSLAPAAGYKFNETAIESERLEKSAIGFDEGSALKVQPGDWPMFRANHSGTMVTRASIGSPVRQTWQMDLSENATLTAPTAAGGLAFLAGWDGIVRALDTQTGKIVWRAFTGGAIRLPPTLWQGRALVSSGDGWVYAFDAKNGRQLWRFRAAPRERRIPVYGALLSTWPAASGVLVHEGTAYVAAGIVNYDGTHVYALDAASGALKWQNNSSGHLDPDGFSGVSAQGQMMIHQGRLVLAGGNVVSPGIYDLQNGHCLNPTNQVHRLVNNNVPSSESPRGWELYQLEDNLFVSGKPYYAHPDYDVYDGSVFNKTLVASSGNRDFAWVNNVKVFGFPKVGTNRSQVLAQWWGKTKINSPQPLWETPCPSSRAMVVASDAILVASTKELQGLDPATGRLLWAARLPAPAVHWGLAVDRAGNILVVLENGRVVCFRQGLKTAATNLNNNG